MDVVDGIARRIGEPSLPSSAYACCISSVLAERIAAAESSKIAAVRAARHERALVICSELADSADTMRAHAATRATAGFTSISIAA